MSSIRAHLLRVTALSGAALTAFAAHAGTPLALWGFEDGTLGSWTSGGSATVVAQDTLDLGGTTFELGANGAHMAKILPDGSSIDRTQAESSLGLTAGTFAGSGVAGIADSTNFGFITTTTYLDVGEYSFGWSYAAQDYAPYDDGVFFTLAGGGVSSVSVLASNFTGQADTVLVGTYGSTPWRVTSFTIATAGNYQLGFGAYNNRDTGMDPVLFLDNGIGSLKADGVVVAPATPSAPVIDNQQPSYAISNVGNGTLQPVFSGGTLLVDVGGSYDENITINSDGGTIDSNGLDAELSGNIGGAGGLTKTGAGTLTLTGTNSYAGPTTVSGGRLVVNSASLPGNVTNNGTLEFAQSTDGTFAGAISGSGGLTKSGAGTLTLTGANSYTGDTTIQQGKLIGSSNSIKGNVANNGALEFAQATDGTFGGAISGSGGLTKSGAGTLTLTGANSYTGDTTIQQGKLVGSASSIKGNVTNNGTLEFAQSTDGTFGGNISGSGTLTKSGAGALTLSGSNEGLRALVTGGTLVAGSQQAIGSTGGAITLSAGTGFQAGADLTISQSFAVLGADARIDTGAHTVVLAGGGSGNACLIKTGSGHLNLVSHIQNSVGACLQQGLMSFNNVFDGNVTVNNGATMAGSGTINGSIVASGTISPGNSPGVMVVNGSVTQLAGSTLALDIDGASAGNGAGHHDAIVLNGAGSIYTAAGLVAPKLRGISGDATNSFTPVLGQTFEVVTAEGGVTGSFDGITQPTDGMPANTRFDVIYRANSLLLVVTPGSYARMADATNAVAAGTALEALRPVAGVRSTAPANPIFERLAGLDAAAIAQSLEQLSGSIHASAMDAALQGNRNTRANILQHLKVRRAIDEGVTPARGLWGSASKLSGGVDADGSGRGYRHESESYSIGFDIAPGADWTVGLAGTYAETRTKAGLLGEGKSEAYQANLYAIWARSGSYATGQIAFGTTGYDIRRSITLNGTASNLAAAPDGSSLGAEAEAGHRFALGAIGLTPFVGVAYDRLSRDGVTETGDALIGLQFGKAVRSAWAGRAGARLDSGNAMAQGQLRAYASGALVTELGASRASPMAVLQGAGFRIAAANPGKTAFQGEAGLSGALSSAVRIDLGYRHLSSGSSHANSLSGTLRIRW